MYSGALIVGGQTGQRWWRESSLNGPGVAAREAGLDSPEALFFPACNGYYPVIFPGNRW